MCHPIDTSAVNVEQITLTLYHLTGSCFVSMWLDGDVWRVGQAEDDSFERPAKGAKLYACNNPKTAMKVAMWIAA
jgi:hypothetical protein